MSAVNTGVDSLGLFFTGGTSNSNPDSSLGGAISSTRVRGLGHLVSVPIPAIRIDNVFPACGEGEATLLVNPDDTLVFTPPGGSAGDPLTIAAGASAIITGQDTAKAMRIFRESGLILSGLDTITFRQAMNGVLAQGNVTDAQRQAGVTTYRAFALQGQGSFGVQDIKLWFPPTLGYQATFSLAVEVSIAGVIQTIADEETAPIGLSFVTPTQEEDALLIPAVDIGPQFTGIWIRRTFPSAGVVSARENVQLTMKYQGV